MASEDNSYRIEPHIINNGSGLHASPEYIELLRERWDTFYRQTPSTQKQTFAAVLKAMQNLEKPPVNSSILKESASPTDMSYALANDPSFKKRMKKIIWKG